MYGHQFLDLKYADSLQILDWREPHHDGDTVSEVQPWFGDSYETFKLLLDVLSIAAIPMQKLEIRDIPN